LSIRIIPRLDIKSENLVKGIHLEGIRVLGRPEQFARYYYENGADELLYMDAVATLYDRNSILEVVRQTSAETFIPLTVGGGLRSLEDIRNALHAGADKVSLNTAAIRTPNVIREASEHFGSSTIVISIEAKRRPNGGYEAYTDCGRESTGIEAISWAKRVEELGAGEILVTSIDREGTGQGYDLDLTRQIANSVSIPTIACGGAGCTEHVLEVVERGAADAISIASMLHYTLLKNEASFEDSAGGRFRGGYSRVGDSSIKAVKRCLVESGLECRLEG